VNNSYPAIRELAAEVVVISFTAPALVRLHVEKHRPPFPIVSDSTRACYQAFGLERMTYSRMLSLGVLARGLGLMGRGWVPGVPRKGEDILQLGGDFVLDASRRMVFAHRSKEMTDRPAAKQLLDAVKSAREVPPGQP
jgi:hypothetical protein